MYLEINVTQLVISSIYCTKKTVTTNINDKLV